MSSPCWQGLAHPERVATAERTMEWAAADAQRYSGYVRSLRRLEIDFDAIGNVEAHLCSDENMDVARFHAVIDGAPDELCRILGAIEGIGIPVPVGCLAVSHDDHFRAGL